MLRYVILIARRPGLAALARSLPPQPSADWTCGYATDRCCVWVGGSPTRLGGRDTGDGYVLGAPSRPSNLADEPAGYLSLLEGPERGSVVVERDPGGAIAALMGSSPDFHIVCSRVEDLECYGCEDLAIDWRFITYVLQNNSLTSRRTGFTGVQELLPGEAATFQGDSVRTKLRWSPAAFYRRPIHDAKTARTLFRQAAEDSARAWAKPYQKVFLDLSGGLDSAAMLGLLRKVAPWADVTCVNFSSAHVESDERGFARESAALHGAQLVEYDAGGYAIDYASARLPPLMPRPSHTLSRLGFEYLAKDLAKRAGAEVYMTGRGGDHLFYAHIKSCWAVDHLWTRRSLPGWLWQAYLAARFTGRPLKAVLQEAFSEPRGAARLAGAMPLENVFCTPDASADIALDAFAHPWIAEAIERAPPAKLRQVVSLVELQRHYLRFGRSEIMDEVHPFISRPMTEIALRTSCHLYPEDGVERGLQREVFKDLLPQSIYARRTKGATTSHALRVITENLDYLRTILLEGELVARGLLDRRKLEERLTADKMSYSRDFPQLIASFTAQMWIDQAQVFLARCKRPGAIKRAALAF